MLHVGRSLLLLVLELMGPRYLVLGQDKYKNNDCAGKNVLTQLKNPTSEEERSRIVWQAAIFKVKGRESGLRRIDGNDRLARLSFRMDYKIGVSLGGGNSWSILRYYN